MTIDALCDCIRNQASEAEFDKLLVSMNIHETMQKQIEAGCETGDI